MDKKNNQFMKERLIRDYISLINFKDDKWDLNVIKSDIRKIVGEEPGIKVNWKKEPMLNELKGESEIVEFVESLNIIFTDDSNNLKKIDLVL